MEQTKQATAKAKLAKAILKILEGQEGSKLDRALESLIAAAQELLDARRAR